VRRRPPEPGLARAADQTLCAFARVGAVAVAATGFLLRTRTARRLLADADRRLRAAPAPMASARVDAATERLARAADHPALARLAEETGRLLDRIAARARG
jgi:hypothetical protein